MRRGVLIALEGLDGAGTTTQSEKLRDWLLGLGHRVHLTGEPSRGPVGSLLRLFLEKRVLLPDRSAEEKRLGGATLALLFAADRLDHLSAEILPRLAAGWIVVTDRYVLSSLAYQSGTCDLDFVATLNAAARPPDLTVFLDVPPDVCRRRLVAGRHQLELFEKRDVQESVGARYRALAAGPHGAAAATVVVDGDRPVAQVHAAVKKVVGRLLDSPSARTAEGGERRR